MSRTREEQARRDRSIPRPPGGLRAVPPREWLPVWDTVAARPPVRVTGYLVARRYADYADGAEIRPGVELLAEMTCQSLRTVQDALTTIRGYGLLWRYVRGSVQGPRRAVDVCRLTIPDDMTRVPRIGTVHRQHVPVDSGDQRHEMPVVAVVHRQMTTRPPADDRTDHRQELPTTYIRDLVQDPSHSARASDTDGRETDDGEDDEPDPDVTLLAAAVPDADPRDIDWAVTTLRQRQHHGEIRSVRAYLRTIIDRGDASALVDEAATERRRAEMSLLARGDPFASPGNVVAGHVIASDTTQPHTEACRSGDHRQCQWTWCACRCHRQAVTR